MNIPTLFGIVGLLLITSGVLLNNRKKENVLYLLGGISLEVYSIHLGDPIFITLQAVFILATLYDEWKFFREEKAGKEESSQK